MKIIEPSVEYLWCTPQPELMIELSGRTCYKSEDQITPESQRQFIQNLLASGHESVIEHAVASFRIIADRGFTHELVQHRIGSYSQESTRYCNYSKDKFGNEISVIRPLGMTNEQEGIWYVFICSLEQDYFELLEKGCKPEVARSVLPICLKTEIVVTFNFRQWRHFLKLRLSTKAHPMMRHIAGMIKEKLVEISETCFVDT